MQEGTLTFPLFTKADRPGWFEIATYVAVYGYILWGAFPLGLLPCVVILSIALTVVASQLTVLFRRIRCGVPAVQISDDGIRMVIHSGEEWRLKWDEIATVEEQWVWSGNPTLLLCKNTGLHFFRIKVNSDPEVYRALKQAMLDRLQVGTEISLLKQDRLYRLPEFLKWIGRLGSLVGFVVFIYSLETDRSSLMWVGVAFIASGVILSDPPTGWGRVTTHAS